jgi:hypothetical protein
MKPLAGLALAALFLIPGQSLHAQKPASTSPRSAAIDALSAEDLDEVTSLLRDHYLTPNSLSEAELKRATIQGLLDRLGSGASLVQAPVAPATASPFRSEVLDQRIGYLRLGAVNPENIGRLETALDDFAAKSLAAVVLDLRATPPGSDYEQAAEVCRRFTPKGRVLFAVRKPRIDEERVLTSKDDPKYTGLLVVLVDSDSAGSAEVIAAVLRNNAQAMIIGQQTKGEAVEFADLPLPSGKTLRAAVAEITLPATAPVFPGGLSPDLKVDVSQETTNAVLAAELEKGVGELVFETERVKMNEAALVAGVNPEFEAFQAAQAAKAAKGKAPLRDVVLQRAVDFVTTLGLYEKKPATTE